jgi:hypothetical protein
MTVTWAYWDKNGVCEVFREMKNDFIVGVVAPGNKVLPVLFTPVNKPCLGFSSIP